ncbi:MAG: ABC transporter permease [Proteobacteria bacterium]|nr:ABC transporter permease [Pseudomonadota bacterium]
MFKRSLLKIGLRYTRGHLLQTLLLILGIALGVAVVVAIDLANSSVGRSFQLSTESITGKATHQILGSRSGIDQSIYTRLRVELGFRRSAPVISSYIQVEELNLRTMRILGVDPLAEASFRNYLPSGNSVRSSRILASLLAKPDRIMIAADLAEKYQLEAGDDLTLVLGTEKITTRIVGLLHSPNDFTNSALSGLIITDIATAQEILGMGNQISRIDLIVDTDESEILDEIGKILPPDAHVLPSRKRNDSIRQMSKSFELNLTALSLLALLVGMFLIYNTITFSVVQRRHLIGILRALGVTRSEIFFMILSETLVFGLVGTVIGLFLGIGLGTGTVRLVSQTISDHYFTLTVNQLAVSPSSLLKGLLLGLTASLLSAVSPALEATRVAPAKALGRSWLETNILRTLPYLTIGGLLLLAGGVGVLNIPSRRLDLGFGGLFGIVFGTALLVPVSTLIFVKALSPAISRIFGIAGKISFRNVSRSLSRTGVSIASLMVAVSVIIGVGTMVGSFRHTVVRWLESTIKADIYLTSPNRVNPVIDPALVDEIERFPEIQKIYPARNIKLVSGRYANSNLFAVNPEFAERKWIWTADDEDKTLERFGQGWVIVSEPFVWKHRIPMRKGASILLDTIHGPRKFEIAGIFSDFSSQHGTILMNHATYREYWNDDRISGMAVYVDPEADVENLIERIERRLADRYQFVISSNRKIRRTAIDVFDRTFTITIALQILAALVAFIGILNTVMSLMLERMREIGILRANGMTVGQLWRMILAESGLIGFFAGLLAFPLGTALAWILVFIINKRSFGWTLEFLMQPQHYLQAMAVSFVAALLAGIYPAYAITKIQIAQALRTE